MPDLTAELGGLTIPELVRHVARLLASTELDLRPFAEQLGRVEEDVRTLFVSTSNPAVSAISVSAGPGTQTPELVSIRLASPDVASLASLGEALGPYEVTAPTTIAARPQAVFHTAVVETDERSVRLFAEIDDSGPEPHVRLLKLKATTPRPW